MALETMYNMRSPAVKRLMKEAQELREPTEDYYAQPLEDNLFEWHFTVRGPCDTEFEGGVYHGRIILPPEYPMKPPSIILLTPNGRFETNKKICLSISGHHPESWRPSWSIRTALLAIIGFMPTPGNSAIGSLDYTVEERKNLAKKSHEWECSLCGDVNPLVLKLSGKPSSTNLEAQELAQQISFKSETDKTKQKAVAESSTSGTSQTENNSTGDRVTVDEEERKKETLRLSQEIRQRFKESRQKITERINDMVVNSGGGQPTSNSSTTTNAVVSATEIHQIASSRTDGFLSFLLIVILSLAIGGLLTRRVFFM